MKNLEIKPSSIRDFQEYLKTLYEDKNSERTIEYLFSYLFRNVSYLSRSKKDSTSWEDHYIKSISWLLATANKLNIDLESALLKKFPGVCPYCTACPCTCSKTGERPEQLTPEWKIKDELKEKYNTAYNNLKNISIDQYISLINNIYPANRHIWKAVGHNYHFARVLEELGEIHEAYTGFCKGERSIDQVAEELADVLAWLLSAWEIASRQKLTDSIIGHYYNDCPVCMQTPCKCDDYSSRGQRLVKKAELEEFQKKLTELLEAAPGKLNDLKTIIESIESIKENPDTTSAKRVVKQGISVLDKFGGALEAADGIGEKASNIARAILAFTKTLDWL